MKTETKMKRLSLWMLGIAAMLASCSQNEILQDTSETSTLTVTASLPETMRTRSALADEELSALTRCKLWMFKKGETTNPVQELTGTRSGNNFIFTVRFEPETAYDFYCWADGGEDVFQLSRDGNITLMPSAKLGIAQRGVKTNVTPEKNGNLSISLSNAVAKVALATTTAFEAPATVSVAVKSCTEYNLLTGKATNSTDLTVTETNVTAADAGESNPVQLLSFYVLTNADDENQTITIGYNNQLGDLPNVPFKPDWRTLLKGNVTDFNTRVTVTATLDEDWQDEEAKLPAPNTHIITLEDGNPLTDAALMKAAGDDNRLIIHGPMTSEDFTTLTSWLNAQTQNYDLTLQDVTTLEANAFSGCTHLRALKLPSVVSVGDKALALFTADSNLEELWITAKGNLNIPKEAIGTETDVVESFEKVTLYLHQDKRDRNDGGTSSPSAEFYIGWYAWNLDAYYVPGGFVFLDDNGNITLEYYK